MVWFYDPVIIDGGAAASTTIEWYKQFTDPPVFLRKRAVAHSAFHFFQFTPPPAAAVDMGWLFPFSEPMRPRLTSHAKLHTSGLIYLQPVFDPPVYGVDIHWQSPTFTRTVQYQAYAKPEFTEPAFIPDFGWFSPFSDPVKLSKKGISESLQGFSMQGAVLPIIPSFGYFQELSLPKTLARKGLRTDLQQSIIQGAVHEVYSFRSTGPLYVNHRSGRPATFWKGRTR